MTAKVLLVTAHPDDECMFFLPTIRAYLKQGAEVHILCLSIGDADGLGPVRRQELFHACSLLAVPRDRVIAVDDPNLPDGMRVSWPVSAVSSHIKTVVKRLQPMAIVTFDSGGVSWHRNHMDTSKGVVAALADLTREDAAYSRVDLLLLETVPLLLKFIGPFGILLALIARMIRPQTLCCIGGGPLLGWECLAAHHSQFVWYRKLFMTCSQYLYVNTLIPANSLKHSVTQ